VLAGIMKTIRVNPEDVAIVKLLTLAQGDKLLLVAPDGQEYVLAEAGESDDEFERTRSNEELMRLLDERGRENTTYSLDEVRKQLEL